MRIPASRLWRKEAITVSADRTRDTGRRSLICVATWRPCWTEEGAHLHVRASVLAPLCGRPAVFRFVLSSNYTLGTRKVVVLRNLHAIADEVSLYTMMPCMA